MRGRAGMDHPDCSVRVVTRPALPPLEGGGERWLADKGAPMMVILR